MAAKPKYEIRLATSKEELEKIYRFRYDVYVEEMGKEFKGANHDQKMLTDELDDAGKIFYVDTPDGIACTIRSNTLDHPNIPDFYHSAYDLKQFSEFSASSLTQTSRLMVAPNWRRSKILGRFLNHVFEAGVGSGSKLDFCYCAPCLVRLYEYLGYRQYKENFVDPDVGYRIPLVLVGDDLDHLENVRSPLLRIAKKHIEKTEVAPWFRERFPHAGKFIGSQPMPDDHYWEHVSDALHDDSVMLFNELSEEEIQTVLKNTTVTRCKPGDTVVRSGEVGKEMFFILDGAAEIRKTVDGIEHALITLGRSQVFGEIAFLSETPRSADVVALTDLEVLILTQDNLKTLMNSLPEISNKVLFNLSLTLCDRLRSTTQGWVHALDHEGEILEENNG